MTCMRLPDTHLDWDDGFKMIGEFETPKRRFDQFLFLCFFQVAQVTLNSSTSHQLWLETRQTQLTKQVFQELVRYIWHRASLVGGGQGWKERRKDGRKKEEAWQTKVDFELCCHEQKECWQFQTYLYIPILRSRLGNQQRSSKHSSYLGSKAIQQKRSQNSTCCHRSISHQRGSWFRSLWEKGYGIDQKLKGEHKRLVERETDRERMVAAVPSDGTWEWTNYLGQPSRIEDQIATTSETNKTRWDHDAAREGFWW